MKADFLVPETHVLAIASHVVSGYVGNRVAVFVLQTLGCDVSALNTVQFSNHTGYKQWTGTRATAEEISLLFEGLKNANLADFDMMLSGYTPGAAAVEAVGKIAHELAKKASQEKGPGRFFWVLDPVMGDNGQLYVAPDVVPAYRKLLGYADLILPNQFEAEMLSETKITDHRSITSAIEILHERYGTPHIVITSVSLPLPDHPTTTLTIVGSTMTSSRKARPFKINFPLINAYFSGTGDMFAALMVVRMREMVAKIGGETLTHTPSWRSPDNIDALDLPLARAAEKVLGSMHEILAKTQEAMTAELVSQNEGMKPIANGDSKSMSFDDDKILRMRKSKAAELRLVRNANCLRNPVTHFEAQRM